MWFMWHSIVVVLVDHDDVQTWKHFPHHWICTRWGNPRGHSPKKRPVIGSIRVTRLSKESDRRWFQTSCRESNSDSKVHGASMGPIWGRQDPGGPHVGPMNFVIWEYVCVYLVHVPWYLQPAWWHSMFSAQKGPIQINWTRCIMFLNHVNIV